MKTFVVDVRKRNKKARPEYDREILEAKCDEYGNVFFRYPKGVWSGEDGDELRTVTYRLEAGAVDGTLFGIQAADILSAEGDVYPVKGALYDAGLVFCPTLSVKGAYVRPESVFNVPFGYSPAELGKMSEAQLDKIYKSAYIRLLTFACGKTVSEAYKLVLNPLIDQMTGEDKIKALTETIIPTLEQQAPGREWNYEGGKNAKK